jgi:hypothetical protein
MLRPHGAVTVTLSTGSWIPLFCGRATGKAMDNQLTSSPRLCRAYSSGEYGCNVAGIKPPAEPGAAGLNPWASN